VGPFSFGTVFFLLMNKDAFSQPTYFRESTVFLLSFSVKVLLIDLSFLYTRHLKPPSPPLPGVFEDGKTGRDNEISDEMLSEKLKVLMEYEKKSL